LPEKAARRIEALGVRIHHPENITQAPLQPSFQAAHGRLNTELGRLNRILRQIQEEILPKAMETSPSVGSELATKWSDLLQSYRELNPLLPGMKAVRENLLRSWEASLAQFQESIRSGFRSPQKVETYVFLSHLLTGCSPGLLSEELAKARYWNWGMKLAKERGIRLEHMPHQYTSAFRSAQEALQKGRYDAAVIVGPEAFAYEPIFRDLGVATFAVNIPETEFGGKRSLKRLEGLGTLKGRRVLVVEDDVRSGATLKRLLRTLRFSGPFAELGLYLGLPTFRQLPENVPLSFKQVFIADPRPEDGVTFLSHLSARVPLYKTEEDPP
jgi:hypothetical protein